MIELGISDSQIVYFALVFGGNGRAIRSKRQATVEVTGMDFAVADQEEAVAAVASLTARVSCLGVLLDPQLGVRLE